jgi:hypothetical protein
MIAKRGAWLVASLVVAMVGCGTGGEGENGDGISAGRDAAQELQPVSMVSDWTHRYVMFSRPPTSEVASTLEREPRYRLQLSGRRGRRRPPPDRLDGGDEASQDLDAGDGGDEQSAFQRDWGQSLGPGGSTGAPYNAGSWWPVYPALFLANPQGTAPDCTKDFSVFPTNLAGVTGGQASIIAYNKLYAGTGTSYCGVTNPSVDWSYNTNFDGSGAATTGTVQSSPVLSLDGTKVGFVETRATGGAILHLLKWNAGDGGAIGTAARPSTATTWTADGHVGDCPVSGACMISIVLDKAQPDTASSPFYDYTRDVIYVGDDNGSLHKIVNAFGISGATPAEVTTGNWPILVHISTMLTSPTFDSVSGNIFTEDSSGVLSYVRETFSSAGACHTGSTPCLGSTTYTPGIHVVPDAPIVDSVTQKVFVFFGSLGSNTAVVQSDTTLSANVTVSLGTGTGHHIHAGSFDNAYLTGNGSQGRMYVCGSSTNSTPTLQRLGFTNSGRSPASPFANPVGTMNAAVDTATLAVATGNAECSPVTEFFNANAPAASADQIFFSVQNLGKGSNCGGGGCVMSVNVTGIPTTLAIANSIPEIGGASGIIVDGPANTTTFAQASSIYFSRQGNSTVAQPCNGTTGVGCAVKVTQASLN